MFPYRVILPRRPEIASRVSPFTKNFDDGYKGEVNLGIGYWADIISSIINSGFVITIDYGLSLIHI